MLAFVTLMNSSIFFMEIRFIFGACSLTIQGRCRAFVSISFHSKKLKFFPWFSTNKYEAFFSDFNCNFSKTQIAIFLQCHNVDELLLVAHESRKHEKSSIHDLFREKSEKEISNLLFLEVETSKQKAKRARWKLQLDSSAFAYCLH